MNTLSPNVFYKPPSLPSKTQSIFQAPLPPVNLPFKPQMITLTQCVLKAHSLPSKPPVWPTSFQSGFEAPSLAYKTK